MSHHSYASECWWCVKSPQYGLLPFTAHTDRRGAIDTFVMHGPNRLWTGLQIMKEWRTNKREGFRCVRIRAIEVRPSATGGSTPTGEKS